MKLLFFLLFAIACSQVSTKPQERYEVMDGLWIRKATKAEVTDTLGIPSEQVNQGMVYRPPQSRASITSAHFFDKNGLLQEQFILLHEDQLQELKAQLKCSWSVQEKVLSTPHTVRKVESGQCNSRNITYDFLPQSVLYEVRWKR